jgi:acyl-CoA thioesterase-1
VLPIRRVLVVVVIAFAMTAIDGHEAIASDRVIAALGDSLTAGLGVAPDEAWPALLEARLQQEGFPYRVVNAGVSGDTSAGGLARLDWVLRNDPEIVIVALGANDGLRGQPITALRGNLRAIVDRLKKRKVKVLLAGMRLPPNYGAAYTRDFAAVFVDVARQSGVPLVPFLLDGVAANASLNLTDGIHPNAAGHRIIAERLWPHLRPLLTAAR